MAKVRGVNSTIRGLATFGQKGEELVKNIVQAVALEVNAEAKQNAPVDLGNLKNSIVNKVHESGLRVNIEVGVSYAAYVEFGTGGFVFVPKELTQEALKFKGESAVAGMKPQPYLYPAFVKYRQTLKPKLQKALERLAKTR